MLNHTLCQSINASDNQSPGGEVKGQGGTAGRHKSTTKNSGNPGWNRTWAKSLQLWLVNY